MYVILPVFFGHFLSMNNKYAAAVSVYIRELSAFLYLDAATR